MRTPIAFDDDASPPARHGVARTLLRAVTRHPATSLGYCLAFAFTAAVAVNALFLQSGPHPAPLISGSVFASNPKETTGSLVTPTARPATARAPATDAPSQRTRAQIVTAIQQELAARGFYDGAVDGIYGPKMDAGIREFQQAAGMRVSGDPSEALLEAIARSKLQAVRRISEVPPATPAATGRQETRPVPTPPSRRIIAVQRALSDFGYGQLRLTGLFDEATKAAIEKFERERKLPVRGQISDRLLRELAAVTGRPLE